MRAGLLLGSVLTLSAIGPSPLRAQRLLDVREIPADTLRDIATARFVQGRPVIYYNPALLREAGPALSAFFMAHEYGHVRRGDEGAALARGEGVAEVRRKLELDADCYAVRYLAEEHREAVLAALRFFTHMGNFTFDTFHPTGSQRAAKILACLPAP